MKFGVAATVIVLTASPAMAQDNGFSIEGSVRARVETLDGQPRSTGADSDTALLLRTAILAEYRSDQFRIGAELVDSRSYFQADDSSVSTTEVNAIEPIQAYVAWRPSKRFEVQAGRFTLDLGSRRLVSRNNFRNTINGFTGIRADLGEAKGVRATLFYTLPQQRLPDDHDGIFDNDVTIDRERWDQQFFGGFATIPKAAFGTVELYALRLTERDAPGYLTRNRRLFTIGARIVRAAAANHVDYDVEGAFQGGGTRASTSAADTTDRKVSAGFVQARIGYSFAAAWKPHVGISYDYVSGETTASDYSRFDTLFGARVFEFGPTSLYGAVSRANLSSPSIRFETTPSPRLDTLVALRGLWLASGTDSFGGTGVRDSTGQSGRHAGTQIEARARYWLIPKQLRLSIGGALLAKGRFLRDAPNAQNNGDTHYGFVEATYSF